MRNAKWTVGIRWPLLALLVILHSAFWVPHLLAHPVPRGDYDRNVTVTWRADGVHILYRLEIDEYTLLTTVGNPKVSRQARTRWSEAAFDAE